MRFHYPSSFLKLLLIGFAFAVLPLLWAFVNVNIAYDRLADKSEQTIFNAVETTRASRIMQEQLYIMERSARQYFVLQDELLFKSYLEANSAFNQATQRFLNTSNNSLQKIKLEQLDTQAKQLMQIIVEAKDIGVTEPAFLDNFSKMTAQIESIVAENNSLIDAASTQLTLSVQKKQKSLLKQSLILIPLALLVAAVITFMLARPIRRMDHAIKDLGAGNYDAAIEIDGPGDLRALGHRLDWLRTELKELNIQKQQFLQHVSHELKTPLTAIREAAELLRDGVGGALSKQQAEITDILRDNSVRLQKMIENLLNYTKIDAVQPKLKLTPINFSQIANQVIETHALSIRSKNLQVEKDYSDELLIVADEEKLTIILDNLISNAVKYTLKNGNITISAKLDNQWLIFEVHDNGPGLSEQEKLKLFDAFYRGEASQKSLIRGTGLGLAITKNLVEIHGGSIKLVSSAEGAHFVVHIPTAQRMI